ncbi:hypothetical protein LZG71_20495 [Dyadobacter sp. CY312]|nr:hypothetical protein [Dyadobacter sp. CY312]MCE7042782.1 hypothetical protein [Dyadobacter sp. CY312]
MASTFDAGQSIPGFIMAMRTSFVTTRTIDAEHPFNFPWYVVGKDAQVRNRPERYWCQQI